MSRIPFLAPLVLVLLLAGCPAARTDPRAGPSIAAPVTPGKTALAAQPGPSPSVRPGGCGSTPILFGALPEWTRSAGPPNDLGYVISHEGNLVGMLFADLLRMPSPPGGPHNKILWIVREPREGKDLRLRLFPGTGGGPEVIVTESANASPGQIYPSIVDVTAPGCWHVSAEWNGNRATLELAYQRG